MVMTKRGITLTFASSPYCVHQIWSIGHIWAMRLASAPAGWQMMLDCGHPKSDSSTDNIISITQPPGPTCLVAVAPLAWQPAQVRSDHGLTAPHPPSSRMEQIAVVPILGVGCSTRT